MQVTIRAEDVILIGSLLAALGGIGGFSYGVRPALVLPSDFRI